MSKAFGHAGPDPASSPAFGGIQKDWIPAFAGMTILIKDNIFKVASQPNFRGSKILSLEISAYGRIRNHFVLRLLSVWKPLPILLAWFDSSR